MFIMFDIVRLISMQYVNERLFAFNTVSATYMSLLIIRLCLLTKHKHTHTLNGNLV